ncbi:PREDICTED: uncharacterized protein LOC104827159 [Tarenaya hassleriana]|uniref:uncharacterized protein LOC104827159 n=1 Tax=Tarenaya hassleriana TaxID=28532 RepID=UPI00053C1E9C|nr:PREDICTED: uncharacterized protein LOC104827159 [Tarenaya hassleriana]
MDCDKRFSSGHLILKPEELRLSDLVRLILSGDVEKPRLVDSSDTTEPRFRRRILIFVSVVVLKILLLVSAPLSLFGSASEFVLNFLSHNTFSDVFLRGEVVIPEKSSPGYVSFVGYLDTRISLDTTARREDGHRFYAALCIMASKFAYENPARIKYVVEDYWKMKFLGMDNYWNEYLEKNTTQAFMMSDESSDGEETIVVSFRGTEPFNSEDWCSDFDITWYELPDIGRIHGGFMKALGLHKNYGWPKDPLPNPNRKSPLAYYAIRDKLKTLTCHNQRTRFVLTGHSLGGALAILFVAVLIMDGEVTLLDKIRGVYTYGQPRVGDSRFAAFMEKRLEEHDITYYRFVYNNDIVPRLPFDDKDLMFKHFGTCVFYDRRYDAKVLREEPNKNFFCPAAMVRMTSSAAMELVRSFTIAAREGPEFEEGWLQRVARVFGLFLPGISNHSPQDYVNAIRLGPSHVFRVHRNLRISN